MTAKVRINAGDLFTLIETRPKSSFCDICNGQKTRTADYKHVKAKIHMTMLYKKSFTIIDSLLNE